MQPIEGTKWIRTRDGSEARVMGVVEGYVVARLKGCVPFLRHGREFVVEFELKVDEKK